MQYLWFELLLKKLVREIREGSIKLCCALCGLPKFWEESAEILWQLSSEKAQIFVVKHLPLPLHYKILYDTG